MNVTVRVMKKAAAALLGGLVVASGASATLVATAERPAAATAACTDHAANTGSDANPGTAAAPYRSLAKLLQNLSPGDVGCLRPGDRFEELITIRPGATPYIDPAYSSVVTTSGTATAPVVLRSGDGVGRAKITGQIHFAPESHDITFDNIDFTGLPRLPKGTHLNVDGDRIAITNSDVTNPWGICIDVGGWPNQNAYQNVDSGDPAVDVVLDGNRIHHCGTDTSVTWTTSDSGAHGVYITNARGTRVTNNAIYDNKYRGFQSWPKGESTLVANNILDGNASNVNIGSALSDGYQWVSRDTLVRDNVITHATLWNANQNSAQVHGYFPANGVDYGNRVTGNCMFHVDPSKHFSGNGYAQSQNLLADPLYMNRAAKDFRLQAGSPCVGKGPSWAQPTTTTTSPDVTLSLAGLAVSTLTGDEASVVVTVSNRGSGAAGTTTTTVTVPTGIRLLAASAGCAAGGATVSCSASSLAAGGKLTYLVTLGMAGSGSSTVTATVDTAGDATTGNNATSIATTTSGAACTMLGTPGNDSVQGTKGADVFCGFSGNDTFMPDAGNDQMLGGPGNDRVSYWNVPAAVVVNLGQQAAWDKGATTAIGWDTFRSVETAFGSSHADTLAGSARADTLFGLEGDDEMWGYAGNDRLLGGTGNDSFNGGDGTDTCTQDAGTGPRTACEA